jgi:radical SAM superfamily enzyme YgiQ (UPF0313 family)
VSRKAAYPPLGLLTVAAMLPAEWNLRLIDLNVQELEDGDIGWADYVMISAMLIHADSVRATVQRCRRGGKPVIAGGPLFTTGHEGFDEIDHFLLGEAEGVVAELVADLRNGSLRRIYQGQHWPDLSTSPVPRWDLVNLRDYVNQAVQFSRGCPFTCEFCDIATLNGRVPRTKTSAQFIAELDALHRRGWHELVFVVDDNFIGNRREVRALLEDMIVWRARTRSRMYFLAQASLDLVDDPGLCALLVKAGFRKVFIGIETPSADALEECHKRQNQGRDLVGAIRVLQKAGLEVMAGFIVGFDSDSPDVFRRQFEFIQRSGVAAAMVGLLTALPQTRLYQRLRNEGRILTESTGNNTRAVLNFVPKLDRDFLLTGYRRLMESLYEPRTYYQRIRVFLEHHSARRSRPNFRFTGAEMKAFFKSIWMLGLRHSGRWAYWRFAFSVLCKRPSQFREAIELAIVGYHFRRMAGEL